MRYFPLILCLFFLLLLHCKPIEQASPAEITQSEPPTPGPVPVRLDQPVLAARAQSDSAYKPLRLGELHIRVQVLGHMAHTEMELLFTNDSDHILEGELYFPLGEGQTVSGFAMDVNGKLRDAVAIEKARGRQVFESIVRQQVDPGLLEWTRGNTFRTRVYPIPAHGHKRVRVSFEQELKSGTNGPQYLLPLNFQDKVDEFSVAVQVIKQHLEPTLEENELMNFIFRNWQDSWIANSTYKNYLPNEQLGFSLPQTPFSQQVFVESRKQDADYFFLSAQPDTYLRERRRVRKIGILWDHSRSAAQRDTAREMAILAEYFDHLGTVTVELIPFSNQVGTSSAFEIRGGKWQTLRQAFSLFPFDGATQIGVLDLSQYVCDEFLLLSDGLSNFGESTLAIPERPIHVLTSGPESDYPYLRQITSSSGGRFLNLNELLQSEAIRLLNHAPYRFLSAKCTQGTVEALYPNTPQDIQGRFALTGKLISQEATIVLNFGFGNQVVSRKTFHISKEENKIDTGWVPRMWAQKKLAALDAHPQPNRPAITELCKSFGLASRYTSLLILDRIEDYVENRIPPPPDLLSEYEQLLRIADKEKKEKDQEYLEEVVEAFQERIDWWNTTFSVKPPPPPLERIDSTDSLLREEDQRYDSDSDGASDWGSDDESERSEAGYADAVESSVRVLSEDSSAEPEPQKPTEAKKKKPKGKIELAAWSPDSPYLDEIKAAAPDSQYTTYLRLRTEYGNMPAFFLEVAQFFEEQKQADLALRILSNIAELELENHELLRILGHRLRQTGHLQESIYIFREVLAIREEEPQSYRDLALVLAEAGELQEAATLLYRVATQAWDIRFPGIGVIATHELNSLIGQHPQAIHTRQFDSRLLADMPTDIRVVLNWDADNVDMDLWVTDPHGAKCFYSRPNTAIGGLMSQDFTGGYGPEEFLLKNAIPGEYLIQTDYYGSSRQRISGPVHIQAKLILHYGKPQQEEQALTLRLGEAKEVVEVGKFSFK